MVRRRNCWLPVETNGYFLDLRGFQVRFSGSIVVSTDLELVTLVGLC